jgi:hypothetical protein
MVLSCGLCGEIRTEIGAGSEGDDHIAWLRPSDMWSVKEPERYCSARLYPGPEPPEQDPAAAGRSCFGGLDRHPTYALAGRVDWEAAELPL